MFSDYAILGHGAALHLAMLPVDGATVRQLARLVSHTRLPPSGQLPSVLSAHAAERLGLVDEACVGSAGALSRAQRFAAWLASHPAFAQRCVRWLSQELEPPHGMAVLEARAKLRHSLLHGQGGVAGREEELKQQLKACRALCEQDKCTVGIASDVTMRRTASARGRLLSAAITITHPFSRLPSAVRPTARSGASAGIHAIEVCMPGLVVHATALEAARGRPGGYTHGLLMEEFSVMGRGEDVVTIDLSSVRCTLMLRPTDLSELASLAAGLPAVSNRRPSMPILSVCICLRAHSRRLMVRGGPGRPTCQGSRVAAPKTSFQNHTFSAATTSAAATTTTSTETSIHHPVSSTLHPHHPPSQHTLQVRRLLAAANVDPAAVGLLSLASHTLLDRSKSMKTSLAQLCEHQGAASAVGVDHVRANGADALMDCVSWVRLSLPSRSRSSSAPCWQRCPLMPATTPTFSKKRRA